MPSLEEDRVITKAAKLDPDAQPLTGKQLRTMVPFKSLRGRPKSTAPKQLVSIRYSSEVLDYFRSTGDGWQTRIDEVLREYVAQHVRES